MVDGGLLPDRYNVRLEARWMETHSKAGKQQTPRILTHDAYRARIEALRSHAESDEIVVQPSSEQDFWGFVHALPGAPKAEIVLMDNGNFRAIWEDGEQSRLAIQFMGAQRGEYVIFKRRPDTSDVSRVAGIDTLNGIKRQIQAFDLMPAMRA